MKITFIGSSHGVPESNRRCSCAMIEVGEKKYLIDIGTDPVNDLIRRGLTPADITAVFVTHSHGDHMNGLVPFIDLCTWFYKDADPLVMLPEIKAVEALKGWLAVTTGELREGIRFEEIKEGLIYDDGTLKVTAMRTGHIAVSYAFRIEAEGKTALFTGDMKHKDGGLVDFPRLVGDTEFDLIAAEGAHFDVMQYLPTLKEHPPKKMCLNHYSWAWVENCWHLKNTIQNEIPTVLATDGLEIVL